MPLLSLPTISEIVKTDDGSETVIADSTVYGGANPARVDVGVHLLAFKVDEDLEEVAMTVEDYDPNAVTSFTVTNTTDGHQKFVMLIFDDYDAADTYERYDTVFRPADGLLYRSISVAPITGQAPPNATYWEVVTKTQVYDSIDTATESANVVVGSVQQVLTFSSGQCLTTLASRNAKENCCGTCKNPKLKDDTDNLWMLIYTATAASNVGRYTEGEVMMRMADNYCDCC
jgi:hypothetical protein